MNLIECIRSLDPVILLDNLSYALGKNPPDPYNDEASFKKNFQTVNIVVLALKIIGLIGLYFGARFLTNDYTNYRGYLVVALSYDLISFAQKINEVFIRKMISIARTTYPSHLGEMDKTNEGDLPTTRLTIPWSSVDTFPLLSAIKKSSECTIFIQYLPWKHMV